MSPAICKASIWLSLVVVVILSRPGFAIVEADRQKLDVQVEEVKRGKSTAEKNKMRRSAFFAIEVERKLIKGIDSTIKFYKVQAKRMQKGSKARLTILERILQLHLEQAAYTRSEEERAYENRYSVWELGGKKGAEPTINTNKSLGQWQAVINEADNILKEYPKNEKADRIIFTQGFAYQYIGQEKEAARIYTKLIKVYPNSDVSGDAYASLGDFYFDRNDFRNAMVNYQKALRYKRSERYLWSMFKLGWCNYNLGKNNTALRYWKDVVRLGGQQNNSRALRVKEEALRDMVYAFAEKKDVQGAISYYNANGGEQFIGPLLNLLAKELADDGNLAEAIKTLKLYQKRIPDSPDAPEAQKELIALTFEVGKLSLVWQELERMKNLYTGNSPWVRKNSSDKGRILEAQKLVKDQMLYYPKLIHKRAQKQDSIPLHQQAKVGYMVFLRNFSKARETVEVKFNIADIEYFLKNYRAAGQQYLEIASMGQKEAVIYQPNSDKGKNVHKESAVYMVDAYAKDFETEFKELQKRKPDFTKPPRPISLRAKNYIKACQTYTQYYPKDAKVVKTCEMDVARIYYNSNDRDESQKFLWLIANKYPNEKEGPAAAELLIPLYKDDVGKLLAVADKLLAIPAYQKGALGEKLKTLKRGIEKEGIDKRYNDPLKKAKSYEDLAKRSPNDPEADILWYNAGVNYIAAGDIASAIVAYLTLIKKYPNSKQTPVVMIDVAQLYERRLEFETAATYFEAFAQKYPADKKSKNSMMRACELLIAMESGKAVATCMRVAAKFPADSAYLLERLYVSAFRAKKYTEMVDLINNAYLKKVNTTANEKIVANCTIIRAYESGGGEAKMAADRIVNIYRSNRNEVSGEALRCVGDLFFRKANIVIPDYSKLKLVGGTVDKLQGSIERKANALIGVKNSFDSVLATNDSFWGIAALHQLGLAHELFANLLEDPPEITGAKSEDVRAQLKPEADKLNKEAFAFYKQAKDLMVKFKVHNPWAVKVVNALNRMQKNRAQFDDVIVAPDFLASDVPMEVRKALK